MTINSEMRVSGQFNQVGGQHGALILWTIRSPRELFCMLCNAGNLQLSELSEIPEGLSEAEAKAGRKPYGVNPAVDWKAKPISEALRQLCDVLTLNYIYRPAMRNFPGQLIVYSGPGREFFDRKKSKLTSEQVKAFMEVGADEGKEIAPANFYQGYQRDGKSVFKCTLEAVGEDWDGKMKPIAQISSGFAPPANPPEVEKAVSFSAFRRRYLAGQCPVEDEVLNQSAQSMRLRIERALKKIGVRRVICEPAGEDASVSELALRIVQELGEKLYIIRSVIEAGQTTIKCGQFEMEAKPPASPSRPVVFNDLTVRIDGKEQNFSGLYLRARPGEVLTLQVTKPVEFGEGDGETEKG